MRTLVALALLTMPVAARSEDAPKLDFSQCRGLGGYPGTFNGTLNDKGDLDVDANAPGVGIEKSAEGDVTTVSVKSPWMNGAASAKYVLTKKDGRPDTMEMRWDMSKLKVPKGFPKPKNPAVGTITRYAYAGNHCYVSQGGMVMKSGKEIVSYDFQACRELLDVVKKFGAKKISECSTALMAMDASIHNSEMRINGEKRELHLGYFGLSGGYGDWDSTKQPLFGSLGPITAAGHCSMTRKMYGMEVDPKSDIWPGGAFVGGIVGMPGGINGNPAPDDENPPKNNDKAL